MDYKYTCETIYTHYYDISDNIYGFETPVFAPFFYPSTTRPPIFLPIRNGFYPSKWQVDGSLHKAMPTIHL